jgi:hypothetical protein
MKKYIILLLVLVGLAYTQIGAQTVVSSSVSGTVQDASGGVIAGAKVQLTNTGTNAVRVTTTSDTGAYMFSNLGVGTYKLEVIKEGFADYVQSGIVLEVNTSPVIPVALKVGQTTQVVQVEADAAMVETQSTGVGQVVNPEQVVDLPLNNRQANQLILLSGAAVSNNTNSLIVTLDYPTAVAISVAGAQGNSTNYYLDGAPNQDIRTNIGLPMPFPDALQEFKVESSAMPANYGRSPGGTVQGTTISGTNKFHGDVFEFLRNNAMDAKVDYSGANDGLKRNQFGGVVGGPIIRDKLFVFGGYQETMERVLGTPTSYLSPTTANLAGDFTAQLGPSTAPTGGNCPSGYLNQAFTTSPCSNIIQPALLQTSSAKIAAALAAYLPVLPGSSQVVLVAPYTHDNEAQGVLRTDWQRTSKDSLFARYFVSNYSLLPYYAKGNLFSAVNPGLQDQAQTLALGDTYVLSSKIVSAPRVYFTRMGVDRSTAPGIPTITQLGSNVTSEVPNYLSTLNVSGYFSTAFPSFPGYDYDNVFGASEDLSILLGKHSMNAGVVYNHNQVNADGTSNLNPALAFVSGSASRTGNSMADFITGNLDSFQQANGNLARDSQNLPSLYIQDNWKMLNHLQLNLGLRWDPFYAQYNKYKENINFDMSRFLAGKGSQVYTNAPVGLTFPGDPGFPGTSDTNSHVNNFAPRFGVVWDPRGRGTETIRAGYGIFYDTSTMWNNAQIVLDPPYGSNITFTPLSVAQGAGLASPWFGQSVSNPFPTPLQEPSNYVFPVGGTYRSAQPNIKPTYTQEWDLSIQKQITANWMVSATYLGSMTTHMWLGVILNPSVILGPSNGFPGVNGTSGGCTLSYRGQSYTYSQCNGPSSESVTVGGVTVNNESARQALTLDNPNVGPYFAGAMIQDESIANASYNGLLLVAQHRLSHDFSVLGNYTWSHCLDDGDIGQTLVTSFQNPSNPKGDWGNCASDRSQQFNASFVAQSPTVGDRVTRAIVGDWSLSGIYTLTSGSWLNVTDGTDVSLTGIGNDRPNKVGNPFAAGTVSANPSCNAPAALGAIGKTGKWFNPCAYQAQAATTFGNTHRADLLGPGNWNFDAALWRTFRLNERYSMLFRVEGFNVLNHLWKANPGSTSLSSGAVGEILAPQAGTNARLLQIAAKINF